MIHIRHIGIFDASQWLVTLIGAGGIGAITAVVLVKMGIPEIAVFDSDTVDDENLATQFYRIGDLGRMKVTALADLLRVFSDDVEVNAVDLRVTPLTRPDLITNPIIISAVDSINTRKEIWKAVQALPFLWYLDARMGAENLMLYSVSGRDRGWYENALASQDEDAIADLPCTAKATIYTAALCGGLVGKTVRQIVTGLRPPRLLFYNIIQDQLLIP
jgi:hypothetical protein